MPHPFDRMHAVPDYEHLLEIVEQIDLMEIFNPRVAIGSFNEEAARFAAKYRIPAGAGSDAHVAQGLGTRAHADARLRRAGGVPRVDPRGGSHHDADELRVRAGAEVPGDEGDPAGRARARCASGASSGRRARADAGRGKRSGTAKSRAPVPATDDDIREKYLERAIREINALTRDLQACRHCPRGSLMPVLGSGHPQADVFLLKYAPRAAEIEEGVAFYGRAGTALMKSLGRLDIDPLAVYGTLCVKCPVGDGSLADPACISRVTEEIAIVQPRIVVVMGEDALGDAQRARAAARRAGRAAARRDPDADAVDRSARHAGHRRVARRGGRQARVLAGLPRARRVVGGPAALLDPTASAAARSDVGELLVLLERHGLVLVEAAQEVRLRPLGRERLLQLLVFELELFERELLGISLGMLEHRPIV